MARRTRLPAQWTERVACACSLCVRTGAWFVLDPEGEVEIAPGAPTRCAPLAGDPDSVEILCRLCGDYIGSAWRRGGVRRIALNGRLFEGETYACPGGVTQIHAAPGDRAPVGEFPRLVETGTP